MKKYRIRKDQHKWYLEMKRDFRWLSPWRELWRHVDYFFTEEAAREALKKQTSEDGIVLETKWLKED